VQNVFDAWGNKLMEFDFHRKVANSTAKANTILRRKRLGRNHDLAASGSLETSLSIPDLSPKPMIKLCSLQTQSLYTHNST
jgi:hypothetical protein